MLAKGASLTFVALLVLVASTGCAMCSNCDDYTYPTQSGVWPRLDPVYGRVGSVFTPEVWAGEAIYTEVPLEGTSSERGPVASDPQTIDESPLGDSLLNDPPFDDSPSGGSLPPDDSAPMPADSTSQQEASVLQFPGMQVR